MTQVQVYTTPFCSYCVRAKRLLTSKGVVYEEIDVTRDYAKRAWLVQATGQRTVPQIFIDGQSHGGYDELAALDRRGALDALLGRSSP